jgi:hypothetical protein
MDEPAPTVALRRVRIEAAPLDSVPGTDEPLGAILLVAGERTY